MDTVRRWMSSPALVVDESMPLPDVRQRLKQQHVRRLPVVNAAGQLVGIVTDRDMFIALGTRNTRAAHVRVGAVATTNVSTCAPDDDVETALATMKQAGVRRLPVVDAEGRLLGIVSINDIVLAAGRGKPVRNEDVVDALQAICAPHRHDADDAAA